MNTLKSALVAIAGLCLGMAAACQTAQPLPQSALPMQGSVQVEGNEMDGYRLGPGDEIKITVSGEPTLSGSKVVDGQGAINMEYIGAVAVRNLTLREVQTAIENKYRDGYLNEPRVMTEMVKGRPFYILGEVNKPAEYPFTSGLTVMNAIAAAGGWTYRANQRNVMITSASDGVEREVQLTPTTPVRPGDRIRVRERLF